MKSYKVTPKCSGAKRLAPKICHEHLQPLGPTVCHDPFPVQYLVTHGTSMATCFLGILLRLAQLGSHNRPLEPVDCPFYHIRDDSSLPQDPSQLECLHDCGLASFPLDSSECVDPFLRGGVGTPLVEAAQQVELKCCLLLGVFSP